MDTTPIQQELTIELPPGASFDQSGVKEGYYRTANGQQKKLTTTRVSMRVKKQVDLDNKCEIGDGTYFVPKGEELVVKVDRFIDNATCPACKGEGHSQSTCGDCGGTRVWWVDEEGNRDKRAISDKSQLKSVDCSSCRASAVRNPFPRSTGYTPCAQCNATGQRVGDAKIAVADQYTSEPTTGIIMAIGPKVNEFNRGQRIFFSQYAGIEYEYAGRKYRIINQRYPLGIIVGSGDVHAREAAAGVGQR